MNIVFPDDVRDDVPIGGKARALCHLADAALPVPPWFVLPSRSAIDDALLRAALAQLGPGPFAVRSSALEEDGAQHSFAGQFETFLDVEAADVAGRVLAVAASAETEHVRVYCREKGLPLPAPPAVLVQQMVDARSAGVAFSADPVSGRRGRTVVAGVSGLGNRLVSGETDADTWHIEGEEPLRPDAIVANPDVATPCLTPLEVCAVASLARKCEAHCGVPQDIEWAVDESGALFLLQSRPITTLGQLPDPYDTLRIWDNSNIAESYGGLTTPLTFSFASRAYEHVYRRFCRLMRVPKARLEAANHVFPQMLGFIRGRVYYNLLSWYRVLALLPGFSLNRSFMEQMMGVREPLPDEIVERLVRETGRGRFSDGMALVHTLLGLVWNFLTLPRQITAFYSRLNHALETPAPPLGRQRAEELLDHYAALERQLLTRWDAPLVNDFFAMIFYGLLRKKCAAWAGDEHGTLQNDLLRDDGAIVSAEPVRRIRAMAALVHAELARTLADSSLPAAKRWAAVRECPEVSALFNEYLAKFGDRCLEELKLESPTVVDDPGALLTSIGAMALAGARPARVAAGERVTETAVLARIRSPLRRVLFRWIVRQARLRVRHRENLRFERTRLFGRVRAIFRELGGRLAADGVLEAPDDVFWLELREVIGLFDGTVAAIPLRGTVECRRQALARWRTEPPPPDRFSTRGPVHRTGSFEQSAPLTATDMASDVRQGLGACLGIVRGRAHVVLEPRNVRLEPGEILVARQTDPGWVVLFPAAAGLLVERGSLLSHSAIVARELGLPCVVSLPGLTAWLQTGDEVEMNGLSGVVRKLGAGA